MSRQIRIAFAMLGMGTMLAGLARAAEPKVGDPAPPFTLKGSDGKTYSLADYKGKKGVILAWYPKAKTPGCTIECTSFAREAAELKTLNVAYFTASVDPPQLNKEFAEQVNADYPILSDPDQSVAKAYGVLRQGGNVANRWTFYIDKDGVIREIDKKINTRQAATDAAAKVKSLHLGG
jgi:peroxiredoxin Q/BCP